MVNIRLYRRTVPYAAAVLAAVMFIAGCGNKKAKPSETVPSTSVTTTAAATSTAGTETTPRETPGTFAPVGDAYYKEAKPEDILTDKESGIRYVKNQLQISCEPGTDKKLVEKICEEIGADIVGYIEMTSDFQIEFKTDKTLTEMTKIGEELKNKYSFIRRVDPHYAISSGPDTENELD